MRVIAWLVEGTWPSCVDAVRAHAPETAEVVLLHVTGEEVPALAHGAFAGLLGRGHPRGHRPAGDWGSDPGDRVAALGGASAARLLDAAAARLGRPCVRRERTGRPEREVVTAAEGADLLVLARDGDRDRLGPHSIGPAVRFAVDHAPCPVLLVWPETAPALTTLPPPPPEPHEPPGPPPPPPPGRR
ncbi:universal stress protein [Streptomyces mexicanus]|uniref:universal stress protein n=1 Tax=Streptomyces mexicanus TaxID=178566 RepID=UPI0036B8CDB2